MKNLKFFAAGLLIIMLFSASDCHNKDYEYLYIKNSSDKAIYYSISDYYPDTTIVKQYSTQGPLHPDETTYFGAGYEEFEMNNTLIFFIFDADRIEQVPWDTIVSNYLILKRFEVTKEDVRNMNDTITYF